MTSHYTEDSGYWWKLWWRRWDDAKQDERLRMLGKWDTNRS